VGCVSSAVAGDYGFKVLYNFADAGDGGFPMAGVIKDGAGNLYGTTFYYNGASTPGTVFKLAPDGTETVLYHFADGNDGGYPNASLSQDEAGNLYGTTPLGGAGGDGVVFMLAPNGTQTVIHSFTGGNDGGVPRAGVMREKKGNLYGTAAGGCCGLVYRLSRDGRDKVLYNFLGGTDGDGPGASDRLIRDTAGNLYGTTVGGGAYGEGVVFKLAQDGTESVLHSFAGGSDGSIPVAGVIEDRAGNLYGTTYMGGGKGCSAGCGTVFKLAPDGTETVLYSFCSQTNCSDGGFPETGLVQDRAGNLYGTTLEGGAAGCGAVGCGTVFRLTPDGVETVLHAFTGGADGNSPNGLIQDTAKEKGDLYGTAQYGGASGAGTVFKVKK
jgi:uncharacterized repeat protein (TIGR03803 family)